MAARKPLTEKKWLSCESYKPMLEALAGRASDRKLRLFAAACARQVWHFMRTTRSRDAVVTAERYADGLASAEELAAASRKAYALGVSPPAKYGEASYQAAWAGHCAGWESAMESASWTAASAEQAVSWGAGEIPWGDGKAPAEKAQRTVLACLLRDIFGNPFRPVEVEPTWLRWERARIVHLARAAYDEREQALGTLDDGRLAVLADALEEAGCTNADILAHCRASGPHVRGCWVLDLILGKS